MTRSAISVTSNSSATAYEPTQHGIAINDKNRLSTIVTSIKENIQEFLSKLRYLGKTIGAIFSAFIDKIIYLYDSISSKFSNKLQDELTAACKDKDPKKITAFIKKHRIYASKNINNPIIINGDSHVTLLTLACRNGQIDNVNKLLGLKKENGTSFVDVNAMPIILGHYSSTALTEIIQHLNYLQEHPNTITTDSDDQSSPAVSPQIEIQEIEEKAILDVIIILINDSNIDLNKKDTDGFTPLMHACVNGQEDIVELLSKTAPLTTDEIIKILEKSLKEDHGRQAKKAMDLLDSHGCVLDEKMLSDNGTEIQPFDYICQNAQYTIIDVLSRLAISSEEIKTGYEIFQQRARDGAIDKQMANKIESAFQSAFQSVFQYLPDYSEMVDIALQ